MTLDQLKEYVRATLEETNKNLDGTLKSGNINKNDYYLGKFSVLQIVDEYLNKIDSQPLPS